jgi:nucleotide-binding universal stress UspA family protein
VREFLVSRWPEESASSSFEDRYQSLREVALQKMSERRQLVESFLAEHNCEIRTHVRRGNVSEELFRFSAEQSGNLIVFGRHHALHTRPFGLGKVPINTMLTSRLPVCMFPAT